MPAPQSAPPVSLIASGPFAGLQGIGGSDAAVILGVSPWKSAAQLWGERTGIIEKPERSSDAMNWGSFLERPLLKAYTEVTGRRTWTPSHELIHPTRPWMYGHLDALAKGRVIEVKTARHNKGWGESGSDVIPDNYYAQVQHYLAVSGRPVADVPALFAGSDFRIFEVPRHEEYIEGLVEVEAHFMESVLRRTEPVLDGSDSTAAFLTARYPGREGEVVATAEQEALVQELVKVTADAEALDVVLKTRQAAIKSAMGDNTRMWTPGVRVDWSIVKGRKAKVDYEAVALELARICGGDHPEAFQADLDGIIARNTGQPGRPGRRFALVDVAEEGK